MSSASFGAGSWTYIVPAGVTRLLVDASGAAGAGAGTGTTGAANGKGGRIVAVVLVTAGESLTVNVGASGDAGGGNGGGAGGGGGGAGGGGTDLRRGSSLAGRLVVAGGGGGRGYWTGAAGGVGGATQGQDGNATSNGRAGTGGGAGTVAFGGTGGTGSCSFSCTGTLGGAGSFGQGGSGAGLGGGGGGGGYWGGGGGGAGESGGAGGGGGSSYVSPTGAVTVATEPGARLGSGEVVLTPDPVANDAPSVTLLSPDDGSTVASQSAPVFTIRGDDPDGDLLWVGRIEVRNSLGVLVGAQFTNPAPSGQSASAAPSTLLPPGAYTWTAVVTDSRGASSPPAPTRSFTVAAPPGDRPLVANGGIAFNGQATLDKFPCPPPAPFGTGPCSGAFAGAWDGQLAGVSGTSAYSVVWAAPSGRLVAAFSYAEWQCVGLETVLGIAKGYGSASAEPGEVQGKWQVPGEAFARDITRVTATFSFDWVRIGTSAVLGLEPFTLSLDVSGLGTQTIVTGRQNGAAAFVLTAATGGGAAPTCGQPLNNVQGEIAGTVPLAQVTQ